MFQSAPAIPRIPALVGIIGVTLAGCAGIDQSVTEPDPTPSFAKALTPIPIAVTVSDSAQYHVRSDGLGEYVDGQQTVTAQIDGFGNLLVTVATAAPPARMLTFDYSAPADPLNPFPATAAGARWFKIKSNKTNNGNPAIGAMNLNTSYCYNVTLAHGDGITQYQDGFNQALNGQATYVTIVRTSSTTWTMATNPACSGAHANWALVTTVAVAKNGGGSVTRGLWDLGFAISFRSL